MELVLPELVEGHGGLEAVGFERRVGFDAPHKVQPRRVELGDQLSQLDREAVPDLMDGMGGNEWTR